MIDHPRISEVKTLILLQLLITKDITNYRYNSCLIGVLAGLVFNKLRPLDLVRQRSTGTEMMGHVKLLDSIPYNYRMANIELFERMQQTQTSNSPGLQDDIIVRQAFKLTLHLQPFPA